MRPRQAEQARCKRNRSRSPVHNPVTSNGPASPSCGPCLKYQRHFSGATCVATLRSRRHGASHGRVRTNPGIRPATRATAAGAATTPDSVVCYSFTPRLDRRPTRLDSFSSVGSDDMDMAGGAVAVSGTKLMMTRQQWHSRPQADPQTPPHIDSSADGSDSDEEGCAAPLRRPLRREKAFVFPTSRTLYGSGMPHRAPRARVMCGTCPACSDPRSQQCMRPRTMSSGTNVLSRGASFSSVASAPPHTRACSATSVAVSMRVRAVRIPAGLPRGTTLYGSGHPLKAQLYGCRTSSAMDDDECTVLGFLAASHGAEPGPSC